MFSRHERPVRASNSVGLGPGDRVHLRTHPEEVFQLKEGIRNAKANRKVMNGEVHHLNPPGGMSTPPGSARRLSRLNL